ncbi:hypothetical protein [Burkholderia anthina]|uniref:hypothetical protein n=1 Tax=Burkholderia anthina TaxID=179879 RepID=UPI00158ABBF4|nr:hypothetical protein [Burkholderia anthina]
MKEENPRVLWRKNIRRQSNPDDEARFVRAVRTVAARRLISGSVGFILKPFMAINPPPGLQR